MTRLGKVLKPGDVVLARVQFVDSTEAKTRPALVLFEELGNVIVAGITSNLQMKGIQLSRKEGAVKDSVIKLNYLFTISPSIISKVLFHLTLEKRREVFAELLKRLSILNE